MNTLKAEKRDMSIKAKKLRREGFVTGNLFGRELEDSIPLKFDKAEIEKIQEKINSINTTVNSLYPIDNVKISDKDKIEKVIADYNSLSSYDKTKVSGFDDTERALAVISEKTRNIIVFAVLTVVAVLLILFVVLRIRKRIKKKKEIDFEEE